MKSAPAQKRNSVQQCLAHTPVRTRLLPLCTSLSLSRGRLWQAKSYFCLRSLYIQSTTPSLDWLQRNLLSNIRHCHVQHTSNAPSAKPAWLPLPGEFLHRMPTGWHWESGGQKYRMGPTCPNQVTSPCNLLPPLDSNIRCSSSTHSGRRRLSQLEANDKSHQITTSPKVNFKKCFICAMCPLRLTAYIQFVDTEQSLFPSKDCQSNAGMGIRYHVPPICSSAKYCKPC